MITKAPRRTAVLIAVFFTLSCFGLILFTWRQLGGSLPLQPQGYRFHVLFAQATQLVPNADVRISGVHVGRVVRVRQLGQRTDATIDMERAYAPVPRDTRAILRQKTLLGEVFVQLTPGSRRAPKLREDGTLPVRNVEAIQPLDAVLNAFDPHTRRAFRSMLEGSAATLRGRGADLNQALGNLDPAVGRLTAVMQILDRQRAPLQRLVRDTGTVLDAVAARRADIRSLVTAGNQVFATTDARNRELTATIRALPPFLHELRATMPALDRTAGLLRPTLARLEPVAPLVRPVLARLIDLVPRAQNLLHRGFALIPVAERALPAGSRLLDGIGPLSDVLEPATRQITPVIDLLAQYKTEINTTFANLAAATQATASANVPGGTAHYLRTLIPISNESRYGATQRLPTNRHNPYFAPGELLDLMRGGLEASDCRNTGNPAGSPVLGTGTPPCRVQPGFAFKGKTGYYPRVMPAR